MDSPIETIEEAGFAAKVFYDQSPMSPEEWSRVGTLAYDTREAGHNTDIMRYWQDYGLSREFVQVRCPEATIILPVRAWDDRMGSELRIADSWEDANGFIFATEDSVKECMGDQATFDDVVECLKAELQEWQQWAQGDVYGIEIEGPTGETIESVWGFYGYDYALDEAKRMLEAEPAVQLLKANPDLARLQVN